MKKSFFSIVAFALCIILVLALAGCGVKGEGVKRIQDAGVLIMCTNAEFEPFEYRENNEVVGIDVDIAREIAADLGVELQVMDMDFNSLVNAVSGNKADIAAAGMTVDETRLKSVNFSDPYFNASQSILVAVGSSIKSESDLEGKIIGVQLTTTGDEYATEQIKDAEVKRYQKGIDAVQDLIAGRIDAVIIDDYPATTFAKQNTETIIKLEEALTEEEYAIALNKNDTDLLEKINESIKRIKESGRLDEIVNAHTNQN